MTSLDDFVLAAGLGADAIIDRQKRPATSSSECEIVSCRMPDDRCQRFVCKFGRSAGYPRSGSAAQPTHRIGLAYEARVYDELLRAWPDDVPPLHGVVLDDATQTLVLALDYLEDGTPLHEVSKPKDGLLAAARWIAGLHRWGETATVPAFLRRYDTEFYRTCLRRTADFTRGLYARYPWLPPLCERGMRRLPALLPPATIIHGEYQANNILVYQGRNVTTDWQSAALAAGEIDLASLTWDWDDDLASLCEQQYCLIRWPDGTPDDFPLRLTAARVYLHLRWLGDRETGSEPEAAVGELEKLAPLATKFTELDR